jgi:acyl dehydratase
MGAVKLGLDDIELAVGRTLVSEWHTVDQVRINEFGRVTSDPDPAHVDPEWAARHSPWGGPIAFGFLTMSLLTPMVYDVLDVPLNGKGKRVHANYGFNRLRLVEQVPSGARIRAHMTVKEVAPRKPGQSLMVLDVTVEIEGKQRPALTAEWLSMLFSPSDMRATG